MKQRTLTGRTLPRPTAGRGRARITHRAAGSGKMGAVAWTFVLIATTFALAFASQLAGR